MSGLTPTLATVVTALAAVVIAVGLLKAVGDRRHAAARAAQALGLGLELLLAAGLLRLTTDQDFRTLGVVGLIVVIRQVASRGIGLSRRALGG